MFEMHTDLPKTINEALKILAYNDYFWYSRPKTPNNQINAHPKDFETVKAAGFFVLKVPTAVVMDLFSFVKLTTKNCKDQLHRDRLPAL